MTAPALRVEGLGKRYRLGLTHAGSLSEAASRLTRRLRGLPPVEAPVDAAPGADPSDRKGDFWALKDVSFEVRPGEVVGVIGRNGAGKSTLLKILSRVTAPTTGVVEVTGRVGSLLEVGTGFHPELTGRENVYMNATLLGMSKREVRAKLDEIVDFAGVEKFLDTPVKRYSSGMKVRLGFAVAAHLEPEVLIVDEVLSVGDAEFQKKCLGKMKDVAGEGRTVLFVSHNMGAVRQLCGRIILLRGGRVVEDGGDVGHIIDRYLSDGQDEQLSYWRCPDAVFPDGPLVVRQLSVRGPDGRPLVAPVSNALPLSVRVELDINNDDPNLTFGYALWREGECLFWSFKHDAAENLWPPAPVGRHGFEIPLPERLLNYGRYRVEFLSALHNRRWLSEPGNADASVTFKIGEAVGDSPQWTTNRRTVLAPVLPWRVHAVGADRPDHGPPTRPRVAATPQAVLPLSVAVEQPLEPSIRGSR